jgi:hypothetical protein
VGEGLAARESLIPPGVSPLIDGRAGAILPGLVSLPPSTTDPQIWNGATRGRATPAPGNMAPTLNFIDFGEGYTGPVSNINPETSPSRFGIGVSILTVGEEVVQSGFVPIKAGVEYVLGRSTDSDNPYAKQNKTLGLAENGAVSRKQLTVMVGENGVWHLRDGAEKPSANGNSVETPQYAGGGKAAGANGALEEQVMSASALSPVDEESSARGRGVGEELNKFRAEGKVGTQYVTDTQLAPRVRIGSQALGSVLSEAAATERPVQGNPRDGEARHGERQTFLGFVTIPDPEGGPVCVIDASVVHTEQNAFGRPKTSGSKRGIVLVKPTAAGPELIGFIQDKDSVHSIGVAGGISITPSVEGEGGFTMGVGGKGARAVFITETHIPPEQIPDPRIWRIPFDHTDWWNIRNAVSVPDGAINARANAR